MASLLDLPAELLDLVAQNCDHGSLKNLRLTGHRTCDAATPLVFEHHYLVLLPYSLQRLQQIADSRLAKHVKKIDLDCTALPRGRGVAGLITEAVFGRGKTPNLGGRLWTRTLDRTSHSVRLFCNDDELPSAQRLQVTEVSRAYAKYCELALQQERWERHPDEFRLTLKEVFARLPAVEEVEISSPILYGHRRNLVLYGRQRNLDPPWYSLRSQIVVGPDDWPLKITDDDCPSRLISLGACSMFEAISFRASFSGTQHIHTLTMLRHGAEALCHWDHLRAQHELSLQTVVSRNNPIIDDAFEFLTELHLDLPQRDDMQKWSRLISAAQALRQLELTRGDHAVTEAGIAAQRPHDLFEHNSTISGPTVWPHLQNLSLSVTITVEGFLAFLEQHAATLRSLRLADMAVRGDLRLLLEGMAHTTQLEEIDLKCIHVREEYENDSDTDDDSDDSALDGYRVYCYFDNGIDEEYAVLRELKAYLLSSSDFLPDLDRFCSIAE